MLNFDHSLARELAEFTVPWQAAQPSGSDSPITIGFDFSSGTAAIIAPAGTGAPSSRTRRRC